MTSAPTHPRHDVRRATRDSEAPILGGVAGGLARHLGLPVLWVRAGFLVATALGGLGIAMYVGLWLVLPSDSRFETDTPGAESASRGGRRPGRVRRLTDAGPAIALAALALGAILVVQATLGGGAVFWPIVIGLAGVALLWRQADEVQRERWLDTSGRLDPVRMVFGSGGWASYARVGAGVVLVVAGAGRGRRQRQLVRPGPAGAARRRCSALPGWRSWSGRGCSGWPPTSAPSARSGSAPRSGPTSPRTCTTRCCRPWP